jgi:hypothetical protein
LDIENIAVRLQEEIERQIELINTAPNAQGGANALAPFGGSSQTTGDKQNE